MIIVAKPKNTKISTCSFEHLIENFIESANINYYNLIHLVASCSVSSEYFIYFS